MRSRVLRSRLSKGPLTHWPGELTRVGSDAAGWIVPIELLRPNAICYCAGVGEDASFDLALGKDYGCDVYSFDPTPRAIAYAESLEPHNSNFRFLPIGLWSESSELRFYEPRDSSHVSHSVLNLQGTDNYFVASCKSVGEIMVQLGHERVDLLKLDIEGAEYEVLLKCLQDDLRFQILCVEFDQPIPFRKTAALMRDLTSSGYDLIAVDGWNCTFVAGKEREAFLKDGVRRA